MIFPVLMMVTLGVIQGGIWVHGHTVAARAAAAGVDLARGSQGSTSAARDRSTRLAGLGGLTDVEVEVERTAGRVAVTVSGRAPVMLDLGLARVRERAAAPVERMSRP